MPGYLVVLIGRQSSMNRHADRSLGKMPITISRRRISSDEALPEIRRPHSFSVHLTKPGQAFLVSPWPPPSPEYSVAFLDDALGHEHRCQVHPPLAPVRHMHSIDQKQRVTRPIKRPFGAGLDPFIQTLC